MENNKFKMYGLYGDLSYMDSLEYSPDEVAKLPESKRGLLLISAEDIEKLDRMTSKYESMDDLLFSYMREVYDSDAMLYNPIIIVDKDPIEREKSFAIKEIVFEGEYELIKDGINIRRQTEEHLKQFPNDIIKFRAMKKIFERLKNKYTTMGNERLINIAIEIYFEGYNYKRSREAYFTLKELYLERENKNGIRK